jgi:segregation and condensation protein B
MDTDRLKQIAEAILLAAGRPLTLDQLLVLFEEHERPERAGLREALEALAGDFDGRGIELVQVASGYRIQVKDDMQPWVSRLWEEKPARYSRALLETLALIAYRQPITRGEIEEVRGVSVSTSIMKTLQEREWVRVVGHREVPGHPAMYGTTREFLDYFNLKSLDELPSLAELRDLSAIGEELELDLSDIPEVQLAPANDDSEAPAEDGGAGTAPVPDAAGDDSPATIH